MKFRATPWKVGRSVVITIPFQYLKDGLLDAQQEYSVELIPFGGEDEKDSCQSNN